MAIEDRYFRFNVSHGLQDISLDEYNRADEMIACTDNYLQTAIVRQQFARCAGRLKRLNRTLVRATLS